MSEKWQSIETAPEGEIIMTKIDDDEYGPRNEQTLVKRGRLWWTGVGPDAMYVYYTPTHWQPLPPPPDGG